MGGRQTRCGLAATTTTTAPDVLSALHCQRQQSTHTKPASRVFKFGMRRVCRSCMTLLLLASCLPTPSVTELSSYSTFFLGGVKKKQHLPADDIMLSSNPTRYGKFKAATASTGSGRWVQPSWRKWGSLSDRKKTLLGTLKITDSDREFR